MIFIFLEFIESLENQFIYPVPKGSKLIFFSPPGVGVNEENQYVSMQNDVLIYLFITEKRIDKVEPVENQKIFEFFTYPDVFHRYFKLI